MGTKVQVTLGILILAALGLRLTNLTFQPLWWDEGWSLYFAASDVGELLELTAVDIHPPLYYLLLRAWISLLGSSVVSIKLLSVAIGTATVPLLYAVGRRFLGHRAGLAAAALLAVSPLHIYYSQEVRMYGLVTLLCLGAVYSALSWDATDKQPHRRAWGTLASYVLAATAALYTQYYAGFLLLGLNLIVIFRWWRSSRTLRTLLPWLAAQVTVLLLFLPWLWYAGGKLTTYIQYKVRVEQDRPLGLLAYLARHLAAFAWGHAEGSLQSWWWAGLLPTGVILLATLPVLRLRAKQGPRLAGEDGALMPSRGVKEQPGGAWAFALVVAVTLVCGLIVNRLFPFNPPRSERLLLLALPSYILVVAAGMGTLWRTHRQWAWMTIAPFLILAAIGLGFFYTVPRYPEDDYRPVAERVATLGLASDAIVCVQPWQVGYFQSYIPSETARPKLVLSPREVVPAERQLWYDDPTRMAADLNRLLAEHGRIWFPDHRSMGRVLEEQIEAHLTKKAYPVLAEWYGDSTVLSFFVAGATQDQPAGARFGKWLSLEGAALSPGPLEAGWGVVTVDLIWRLLENPGEEYQVGVRLVDSKGRAHAQRDSGPGGGLQHFFEWNLDKPVLDRHGLLIPAGIPPGDYTVALRVYRSRDIAVLPVAFEGGSGEEVALGMVQVRRPAKPPPVGALSIPEPTSVEWGDHLRFLGSVTHSAASLMPGESVDVDLFWQARGNPEEDYLPGLALVDAEGVSQTQMVEKPVAGSYPTAWWQVGELVRDSHTLPIPARVPPGEYTLEVSLIRASNGQPVPNGKGKEALEIARIMIGSREHIFQPLLPAHVQREEFGPYVELTGYDLHELTRAPGSPLELTLYWHVLETPDRDYHTFIHLLDDAGQILAQHDGRPGGGQLPTLGWLPGEYLTDTHLLQLPFDLADGEYRLAVGLYEPASDVRLGEQVILVEAVPVRH